MRQHQTQHIKRALAPVCAGFTAALRLWLAALAILHASETASLKASTSKALTEAKPQTPFTSTRSSPFFYPLLCCFNVGFLSGDRGLGEFLRANLNVLGFETLNSSVDNFG
jgi:hypothetical protein